MISVQAYLNLSQQLLLCTEAGLDPLVVGAVQLVELAHRQLLLVDGAALGERRQEGDGHVESHALDLRLHGLPLLLDLIQLGELRAQDVHHLEGGGERRRMRWMNSCTVSAVFLKIFLALMKRSGAFSVSQFCCLCSLDSPGTNYAKSANRVKNGATVGRRLMATRHTMSVQQGYWVFAFLAHKRHKTMKSVFFVFFCIV